MARLASVSRATVSYVLNGKSAGLVSDETCERVYAAARQVGYRVNNLAKGLKSGRTALIGVFCKVREDSFHARLLHGIYDICYDAGYNVLIAYLGANEQIEEECLQRMLDYNVTGIIRIASANLSDVEINRLSRMQTHGDTPCVLVDDPTHGDLFDSVVSDDKAGAIAAVQHLISLGHTRIGHINTGNVANRGRRARHEGFLAAMRSADLPANDILVSPVFDNDEIDAIRAFMDQPDRPTALFCTNDWGAGITREVVRKLGIRVPEDLAIVGFGDNEIAKCSGLTTVHEEPELMGQQAVRLLLARKDMPAIDHASVVEPTRLVIRESTRPVLNKR